MDDESVGVKHSLLVYRRVCATNTSELAFLARLHEKTPLSWGIGHEISEERIARLSQKFEFLACSNESFMLVAESGNAAIVGFHWVDLGEDENDRFAFIKSLWVDEQCRNCGIASELKRAGEAWARHNAARFLKTTVYVGNHHMLEFNRRRGFEVCEGSTGDFLEMRKSLVNETSC